MRAEAATIASHYTYGKLSIRVEVGRMIREANEKRERTQEQEKKHVQEQKPRRAARIA